MSWTDLHSAAFYGDVKRVKELLEKGADPNIKNYNGWTPLHIAASGGHVDVVKLLLEHGADPRVKDKDGKTPLDLAREKGYDGVVSLIEEWLMSAVICETYREAWRIIDQVYDFVREGRAMTEKELEDLERLFYIFKGHVEALEAMTAARPEAVKELMICFRDYIELLIPHLRRGDLPGDAIAKITSMRYRFDKLREELACRC